MEWEAGQALLKPLRLAVPEICAVRDLALLTVEAREEGVDLEVVGAGAAIRAELARSREVRAALVGTPEDGATWVVELGLAGVTGLSGPIVYVESLRPARADRSGRRRRIWIQPEDDVPHIRDPLFRIRDAAGLLPAQVVVAPSLTHRRRRGDGLHRPAALLPAPGRRPRPRLAPDRRDPPHARVRCGRRHRGRRRAGTGMASGGGLSGGLTRDP